MRIKLTSRMLGNVFLCGAIACTLGAGATASAVGSPAAAVSSDSQTSAAAGTSAAGITAGSDSQNGTAIYRYLRSQGYTPMQAAGAVCSMWGEAGWDPESWDLDTNGLYSGGIMQWNGPNYPNYVGQTQPSGNATADLQRQLPAVIKFVNGTGKQGYVSQMADAPTVLAASQIWSSNVEEAGISDAHATGALYAAQIAKAVDGVTLAAY